MVGCVYGYLQVLVYDQSSQNIDIELYDEDPDKDDFLGRCVSSAGVQDWV